MFLRSDNYCWSVSRCPLMLVMNVSECRAWSAWRAVRPALVTMIMIQRTESRVSSSMFLSRSQLMMVQDWNRSQDCYHLAPSLEGRNNRSIVRVVLCSVGIITITWFFNSPVLGSESFVNNNRFQSWWLLLIQSDVRGQLTLYYFLTSPTYES